MIETTDMYLAAVLLAYGGNYQGTDKTDVKRQQFLFGNDIGIEKIYILHEGQVTTQYNPTFEEIENLSDSFKLVYPPNYPQALKRIKTIIHK